jgi:hypothetical protein
MRRLPKTLLTLAALAALAGTQTALAAGEPRVTAASNATRDDNNPARQYTTPFVAVDPDNPLRVVISFMEARSRRCSILVSNDGGSTWSRPEGSASPDSYPFCYQLQFASFSNPVAFGRSGTLYQGLNGWDTSDGGANSGNVSVILGRSDDLGDNWQSTLVHNARGKTGTDVESNGPMHSVVVDTKTGSRDRVYLGWSLVKSAQESPNGYAYQPMLSYSTDGGVTFAPPVNLAESAFNDAAMRAEAIKSAAPSTGGSSSEPPPPGSKAAQPDQAGNFGGWGPRITVDDKGTVYAAWESLTSNISPSPPPAQFVSKSTDQGRTWTHARVTPHSSSIATYIHGGIAWTPEGGKDGSVHVLYGNNDRPEIESLGDIFHVMSADGGRTWSEPRNLSDDDDPSTVFGQYYGNISAAPNGRLDVAWWDTRDDPGIYGNDVYYRSSEDGGKTWSPSVRVTDRTVSRKYGTWGFNFDMSSSPALASTNQFAFLAWDDTRLTDPNFADNNTVGGGVQDVFTAAVQYQAVGGTTSNVARGAIAALGGLIAVGLILLVVARARGGPAYRERPATARAPAGVA